MLPRIANGGYGQKRDNVEATVIALVYLQPQFPHDLAPFVDFGFDELREFFGLIADGGERRILQALGDRCTFDPFRANKLSWLNRCAQSTGLPRPPPIQTAA
jgi:hypothetical protein